MDTSATPSPAAARQKRYRDRQRAGVRIARIRMSEEAVRALIEAGFLRTVEWQDADVERAIYGLLNAARAAGVRIG